MTSLEIRNLYKRFNQALESKDLLNFICSTSTEELETFLITTDGICKEYKTKILEEIRKRK